VGAPRDEGRGRASREVRGAGGAGVKRSTLILAILFFECVSAHAVTIKEYTEMKAKGDGDWAVMIAYVNGIGAGLLYANTQLLVNHAKPLYCPPQTLELNAENYLSLLDDELAKHKTSTDMYIEVVLTSAIIHAFPCPAVRS
jgi:hypothetical protein